MKAEDMRSEPRIPVRHRGTLKSGDESFPCLIENMSQNGVLIMSSREFPVGEVLEFRCELFPGKVLECKVEVRHVSDQTLGLKIVEIDEKGVNLCQLFLEEQYAEKL
jgi:hypothetical protein